MEKEMCYIDPVMGLIVHLSGLFNRPSDIKGPLDPLYKVGKCTTTIQRSDFYLAVTQVNPRILLPELKNKSTLIFYPCLFGL